MDTLPLGARATLALADTLFGTVEWVSETGSTNADVLARALQGAPEGLVRATEHQNAGRGRRDRRWDDEPGAALMVSVLLRPTLPPARFGRLTMAWAVAAVRACEAVTGVRLGVKWPNDLVSLADDRKVAGVLAEATFVANAPSSLPAGDAVVVIGMGLNANGGVPAELTDRAVALAELAGAPVDREGVLIALLRHFAELYAAVDDSALDVAYGAACATIGRVVRVELDSGAITGTAVGVTPEGQLVLDLPEERRILSVGDVVHLRPV